MAPHRFEVTVNVSDWENPGDGRAEADYAKAALTAGGLPDAAYLDGFADLAAQAWIADITEA